MIFVYELTKIKLTQFFIVEKFYISFTKKSKYLINYKLQFDILINYLLTYTIQSQVYIFKWSSIIHENLFMNIFLYLIFTHLLIIYNNNKKSIQARTIHK